MALQSSGSISLSNIQSEFGGVGSHSLSEYRALNALGVTDIPATGTISFNDFYSTSNQVSTTVATEVPGYLGTQYNWPAIPSTQPVVIFG